MYNAPHSAARHSYVPAHRSIPATRRRTIFCKIIFILTSCLTGSSAWSQQWTTAANLVDIYSSLSGNVGIGTTTPQAKLDLNGNGLFLTGSHKFYLNELTGYDPAKAGIRNNAGNPVFNAKDGGMLFLNRDISADTWIESTTAGVTTEIATFKSNGNVGIGTTTPRTRLDVNGVYYMNRPSAMVDNMSTLGITAGSYLGIAPSDLSASNDTYMVLSFPDNNSFRIGTNYDGHIGAVKYRDIQFGRYVGDAYMTIKDGGNVCIGTTDPKGYKLAVNGSAIFTQAVVKLNANWPDYVFHPEYQLPPLESVAKYIRDYRHLPEVPSADSMQRAGIDLGSTQTVLLKKIEELTLYAIRQDQRMKEQDQQVKKQDQQMKEQDQAMKEQQQRLKQQEQAIDLLLQLNKKLEARQASIEKRVCRKK